MTIMNSYTSEMDTPSEHLEASHGATLELANLLFPILLPLQGTTDQVGHVLEAIQARERIALMYFQSKPGVVGWHPVVEQHLADRIAFFAPDDDEQQGGE